MVAYVPFFGTVENWLKKAAGNFLISRSTNKSEITVTEQLEADIIHRFYTGGGTNISENQGTFQDMLKSPFLSKWNA